ncbi:MAG: hypothetical protein HeimAB125_21510 [Candidatus Heimdallarchaeota archaeon AB_125]|nr:MAG: hypothetical protein HeimAB125_21510 [Candidatus Heimdallarchaeota archaeon AB_125]
MKSKYIISVMISLILILNPSFSFSSVNVVTQKANESLNSFDRSTWEWGPYQLISESSSLYSRNPSMAVDEEGNVIIVWDDDTDILDSDADKDIFLRKWFIGNQSWSAIELVSDISTLNSKDPVLDIDEGGDIFVAWEDLTPYAVAGPDTDIFARKWDVNTGSWGNTEIISSLSDGISLDPSIQIDSSGIVHAVWQDWTDYNSSGADYDVFYRTRNPAGYWEFVEIVSTESSLNSFDPKLTMDYEENIHVVWSDQTDISGAGGTDWDVFYKKKDYLTSNWTNTVVLSTESTSTSADVSIITDLTGEIHIVWEDLTDYDSSGVDRDIFYKRWDPLLNIWTTTDVISIVSGDDSYDPKLAIDSEMNLHLVWIDSYDYAGSGNLFDVLYRMFDRDTELWSDTTLVTTESTEDVYLTRISVDKYGFVHVIWEDNTTLLSSGGDIDVFYRKFLGPPSQVELYSIEPNPSVSGNVFLEWSDVAGVEDYYVYRAINYITSVAELEPLAKTTNHIYMDQIDSNGTYFYSVVAGNPFFNSSISNIRYVEFIDYSQTSEPNGDKPGLFENIQFGEIIILSGAFIVMQIGSALIINSTVSRKLRNSSKSTTKKK